MVIDRTHLKWGLGTALLTGAMTYIYLGSHDLLPVPIKLPAWVGPVPPINPSPGSTPLGLLYGTVALAIFIFAALLGARRNHPYWKLGRIQTWLKAHIWLTILTIPLVLFHCGFIMGGAMTQFLMFLYALVMISGFVGLALQNIIPKLMKADLSQEIIYEQIPFVRQELIEGAEEQLAKLRGGLKQRASPLRHQDEAHGGVATKVAAHVMTPMEEALSNFFTKEAIPYLKAHHPKRMRLKGQAVSDDLFRLARLENPTYVHAVINKVQEYCDDKRRIDLQVRMHHWLHRWILFHAPASFLLLVLTILHALVAAYSYV